MPESSEKLRGLLSDLKSRRPEEVMGEAATSSLVGATVMAAISTLALVLVMTVLMFVFVGPTAPTSDTTAQTVTPEPASVTPANDQSDAAADADPETDKQAEAEQPKDQTQQAVEAMGIGETADPDSEPDSLENRLDDLLKGIE